MKIRLWGACAWLAILSPSQESTPERTQKIALGSAPSWIASEQPAFVETSGLVSVVGPVSSSLFVPAGSEAKSVYLAIATETAGTGSNKLALRAPWRLLLLPPKAGDLQSREITLRGATLALQQEPLKLESSCGSCGHHGPAVLTQTPLGTVYLPIDLQSKESSAPAPSRVRFQ